MGKNKNKNFAKNLKPMLNDNKVLIAAIGGIAAGISIAAIFGTEKAKQIVETVENSVKDFTGKLSNSFASEETKSEDTKVLEPETKSRRRMNTLEKEPA